jgi:hypothetical protein
MQIKVFKSPRYCSPLVFYGCVTWPLPLREDHRLKIFENRVPMRIFGQTGDETVGGWIKLHCEGFRNLYSTPNIFRMVTSWRMIWAEHGAKQLGGKARQT